MNLKKDLCIKQSENIYSCLALIDKNALGIAFVVDDNGILLGLMSDGDIRRAIIAGANQNDSIEMHYNKSTVTLSIDASETEIQKTLSDKIKIIPLLDNRGVVVDYASIQKLHNYQVMEPMLGGNELEYVTDCIKTNWISSQGKYVLRFEKMLKDQCGVDYCLATSNGTSALHLALLSLGIGAGDEVIVPNLTFGASVNSIIHSGANPVLVDVDLDSWNLSPQMVREAITSKTKAIMPVHIYGNPCDMDAIMKIAEEHGLKVIEDCAEALGASIGFSQVGTFGDAAAFSFFANKIITCGEGGAVTFREKSTYEKAKLLRDHGMSESKRYWHQEVGFNYRLTNIQAAIGCAQLEQFHFFKSQRSRVFSSYDEILLPTGKFIRPKIAENADESYWIYTIIIKGDLDMNVVANNLSHKGVDSRPIFYPMSHMPAFQNVKICGSMKNSEFISSCGISLPSKAMLTESEISYICRELITVVNTLLSSQKNKNA